MSASLKSQLRAAADRWLERSGLRDPEYRLHSATLAIIYTGFWLLVLAGLAIYAGHRSNTSQWVVMILALILGIATMLWVNVNRKW